MLYNSRTDHFVVAENGNRGDLVVTNGPTRRWDCPISDPHITEDSPAKEAVLGATNARRRPRPAKTLKG